MLGAIFPSTSGEEGDTTALLGEGVLAQSVDDTIKFKIILELEYSQYLKCSYCCFSLRTSCSTDTSQYIILMACILTSIVERMGLRVD